MADDIGGSRQINIENLDLNTEQQIGLESLPPELAKRLREGKLKETVRVLLSTHGNRRTIRYYGPTGKCLRTEIQGIQKGRAKSSS